MGRRNKGHRNYDYSHKTGSEQGLRDDKRKTRIFVLIVLVGGIALVGLLIYLWMIK